jgi:hypothetical protein
MAEHHITCEDCGGPYIARRSDARRCSSCRLLRILIYTAGRTKPRKCKACADDYKPARVGDKLCGRCEPQKHGTPVVTCRLCKQDAPMFERVAVCASCVKSPARQPQVIKGLQNGQASRLLENRDNPQAKV